MLRNVVQTFLRDPVETQRYFEGNGFRDVEMRKLEWDPVQFQKVGTVGFKRRYQAEMVKGRGVKMVSRPAEVIRESIHPAREAIGTVGGGDGRNRAESVLTWPPRLKAWPFSGSGRRGVLAPRVCAPLLEW